MIEKIEISEAVIAMKDAAKTIKDANKVLSARGKLSNDKARVTEILASKYGLDEANRLVSTYWNYFGK